MLLCLHKTDNKKECYRKRSKVMGLCINCEYAILGMPTKCKALEKGLEFRSKCCDDVFRRISLSQGKDIEWIEQYIKETHEKEKKKKLEDFYREYNGVKVYREQRYSVWTGNIKKGQYDYYLDDGSEFSTYRATKDYIDSKQ